MSGWPGGRRSFFLIVSSGEGEGKRALWDFSFMRPLIPFVKTLLLQPNYLPIPYTLTLRIRISLFEFDGGTGI